MDEELPEIKSTATALEEFIKGEGSFIWEDMRRELAVWKQQVEAQYPEADTILEKGRVDGRLEALAYFLTLPHRLLDFRRMKAHSRENFTPEGDEE